MKKTRDEYVKSLKDQLDRWNSDMSKWETQAKGADEALERMREAVAKARTHFEKK